MKHAIFQYFLSYNSVGKLKHYKNVQGIPLWAKRSVSYFRKYANIHGVDYFFFTDRFVGATSNYFEILRTYKDPMFDKYDKVLYVDVDVIPKDMSGNIFDIDIVDIAGWPEWDHPDLLRKPKTTASQTLASRYQHFGSKIVKPKTVQYNIRMINTGVLLWSLQARRKARSKFDDHEKWFHYKNTVLDNNLKASVVGHSSQCLDQPYLNAMWNKYNFDVKELDIVWNRFPTKNEGRHCNFAHYVGSDDRYRIPKLFPELK